MFVRGDPRRPRRKIPIFRYDLDGGDLCTRTAATEPHDQSHKKNDQEDIEQNFRNSSGRGRHTGKSEDRSYERYDQKHRCPIKHLLPPRPQNRELSH